MNDVKENIKIELRDLNKKSLDEAVLYIINEHQLLLTEQIPSWLRSARALARKWIIQKPTTWLANLGVINIYSPFSISRFIPGVKTRKLTVKDIFGEDAVISKLKAGEKIPSETAYEIATKIRAQKSAYVPMLKFLEENAAVLNVKYPDLFTFKNIEAIHKIITKFQTGDAAFYENKALQEMYIKWLGKFDKLEFQPVLDDFFRIHIGPLPKDLADDFANPDLLTQQNKTKYLHPDDKNIPIPTKLDVLKIQGKNNPLNVKLIGHPEIEKILKEPLQILNTKGKWIDYELTFDRMNGLKTQLKLFDDGLVDRRWFVNWINDNFRKIRLKNGEKKEYWMPSKGFNYPGFKTTGKLPLSHDISEILYKEGAIPKPTTKYIPSNIRSTNDPTDQYWTDIGSVIQMTPGPQAKPIIPGKNLLKIKQNNPNLIKLSTDKNIIGRKMSGGDIYSLKVEPAGDDLIQYLRQYELGEIPPEKLKQWILEMPASDARKLEVLKKLAAGGDIKIQPKSTKMTQTGPATFVWMGPKISVTKRNVNPKDILADNIVQPRILVLGKHRGVVITADTQSKKTITKAVNELERKLPKGNTKFDASKINIEKMSTQTKDGFTVIEVKLENGNTVLMFKNNLGVNKDKWFVTPGIGFYKKFPKGTLDQPMQKWDIKDKWFVQNSKSKKITTGSNDYMTELADQLKSGNISTGKPESILPDFTPTRKSTTPKLQHSPDYDPAPSVYKMPDFRTSRFRK